MQQERQMNVTVCSLSLYGLIYCSVESIWCTISNKYLEHINNQWRNTGRWILPEKQPCGIDNIQTKFFSDFILIFIVSIVMRNSFFSVNMIIVILDIAIIRKKSDLRQRQTCPWVFQHEYLVALFTEIIDQ